MSVTPASDLAKILPVVISGGRPTLRQRPTAKFLPALHGVTADPVWLVLNDQAGEYEQDGHELVTYPRAWAEEYAASHWAGVDPLAPGGFLGSFTTREAACNLAEDRGYSALLMLDDNLNWLGCFTGLVAGCRVIARHGGLGFIADILAAVTLATNSRMTGAALDSVNPAGKAGVFARAGFPYSIYIEELGPGRPPYWGPSEEDILHAYEYAADATPATAALVCPLHYRKSSKTGGGMRGFYKTNKRAVSLQRAAPEMARLGVRKTTSNGRGAPRVFHTMQAGAIAGRTPLAVTDRGLFEAARDAVAALAPEMTAEYRLQVEAKITRRAANPGEGART